MRSGPVSESRFAGMVMVGFVLAAALTLGVALAPAGAGGEGSDGPAPQDFEEDGTPDVDPLPTPDIDHLGVEVFPTLN